MTKRYAWLGILLFAAKPVTAQRVFYMGELVDGVSRMRIAGYYAASHIKDRRDIGGFAPCNNYPKAIGKMSMKSNACYLRVDARDSGVTLLLLNTTSKRMVFSASDSALPIVEEAKDEAGDWQPIEYHQWSFCGNSGHHLALDPKLYWEFTAEPCHGQFKTLLRFHLVDGKTDLVSNEIAGRIDPAQLIPPSRRQIMSPVGPEK